MFMRILGVMLIAVGLLIGSSVQAQEQPRGVKLTNAELEKLTGAGLLADGMSIPTGWLSTILYQRTGKAYYMGLDVTGEAGRDEGTWRIAGDTWCVNFPNIQVPRDQCRTIYRLPDGSYESWFDGKIFSAFRVRTPEGAAKSFK